MKIKHLLTKTLLVAAGLCVGVSNAWATTYVSQDYSSGTADWTSGNTGRYTVAVDGYLTVNAVGNGNNGTTITGTTVNELLPAGTDFSSSTDFTMTFDLQLNGGNNQASTFFIYDAANAEGTALLKLAQTEANGTTWAINNNSGQTVTLKKSIWYSFVLSKKGSLLYLTVTPTAGGDAVFEQASITVLSTYGGTGKMIFNTKRYYSFMAIDNVVLRDWESGDTPTGTATTYTITYKNASDETIAESVVGNGLVGDAVTATAAQIADITYNEQKYIYKSGNNEITLVEEAASNVITLVYREAAKYTYTVNAMAGSEKLKELATGSAWEGDAATTFYYPQYMLKDNVLYTSAKSQSSGGYYKYTNYVPAADNEVKKISYTSSIPYVVYFSEGEDITGATSNSSYNADIRCSMGAGGYFGSDANLITLPAGTYRLTAQVWGGTGTTFTFNAGDTKIGEIATTGSLATVTSDAFQLAATTTIKVLAAGGSGKVLDWVYITGCTFEPNSDVTPVIQNYGFESSKDGWSSADNATNSRIWPITNFTNTSGAFSGTNAYENWVSGSLTGKMAQTITGLPDGAYKFELSAFVSTAGGQFVYAKSNGVTAQAPLTVSADAKAYSVNIVVSGGSLEVGLDMNGAANGWAAIDNAKLTYYGSTITATVGSRGYATFNSDYALDLTGTDYAFQVTGVSGSTVTLEAVTKAVAANTPLILIGAGDKEIPVAASGEDISATNKLVAVTADNTTISKSATGTNYVLAYQNEAVVFAPVNEYEPTLSKGQAYLYIAGASAPQFNLQLEMGTTGISDVRSKTEDVRGDFFDLSGRRVAQPTKGLYIVNGKKVLVK